MILSVSSKIDQTDDNGC